MLRIVIQMSKDYEVIVNPALVGIETIIGIK